jgi:hypothetical protein
MLSLIMKSVEQNHFLEAVGRWVREVCSYETRLDNSWPLCHLNPMVLRVVCPLFVKRLCILQLWMQTWFHVRVCIVATNISSKQSGTAWGSDGQPAAPRHRKLTWYEMLRNQDFKTHIHLKLQFNSVISVRPSVRPFWMMKCSLRSSED